MKLFSFIFQDWKANKGNTKGRLITFLFRLANLCSKRRFLYYLGIPYLLFYKVFVEWILTIELPWNLSIGRNLIIYHGQSMVVNSKTIIGQNCVLRHCTTIGNKDMPDGSPGKSPVIGNNVNIGSNACIIGDIVIGNNVIIGSGAVVVKNIMADCIAVGNPAIEKQKKNKDTSILFNN